MIKYLLQNLNGLPPFIKVLYCHRNPIHSFDTLPSSLYALHAKQTDVEIINNLPPELRYLHVQDSCLQRIHFLPPKLARLDVCETHLEYLPPLPSTLVTLNCYITRLKEIPPLPKSLQTIRAYMCHIQSIPPLHEGILHASFGGYLNRLKDPEFIPSSIQLLISNNCCSVNASENHSFPSINCKCTTFLETVDLFSSSIISKIVLLIKLTESKAAFIDC